MTDGIIQKIIKRHMHLQDGNEDTCAQCNKLIEIEQELIEEIKKTVNEKITSHDRLDVSCCIEDTNLLTALIGDTS